MSYVNQATVLGVHDSGDGLVVAFARSSELVEFLLQAYARGSVFVSSGKYTSKLSSAIKAAKKWKAEAKRLRRMVSVLTVKPDKSAGQRSLAIPARVLEIEADDHNIGGHVDSTAKVDDTVNSPAHYTYGSIETIDVIDSCGWLAEFCLGNVVKYVVRHRKKGGLEDLKKARWYLDKAIAKMEAGSG